jgi:hypothetical protein
MTVKKKRKLERKKERKKEFFFLEYPCKKLYYEDMSEFHWQSAQFCEFNNSGNLLLVSGILIGDKRGRIPGEIIIFSLKNKLRICSRISNRFVARNVFRTLFPVLRENLSSIGILLKRCCYFSENFL